MQRWPVFALAAACVAGMLLPARGADETSSGDKLRILYSSRFSFTDEGLPLVTIEIMGGQSEVRLRAAGGLDVLPDGEGGARVRGARAWTVTAVDAEPAVMREWTVVARLRPADDAGVEGALAAWQERGYEPRAFEVGSLFGVRGEVIDAREVLVGIAPVRAGHGEARAQAIAKKHDVETSVHREMIRRPRGAIVARSGETAIRNEAVLWFAPRRSGATVEVEDVLSGGGGSQLETGREDRRYFGMVYVTIGRDGKLVAVNAVGADRFLAGLVPAEIYASSPREALAAQAIAARTELLQKIGTRHLGDPYLLCSSQHCQVYSGAGREHPRTTRAVERTRGVVLLRDGGGLVDARYSASCGGHGEHKENIWGAPADPSLRGAPDAPPETRHAKRFARVTDDNVGAFLAQSDGAYCAKTRFSPGRYRWKVKLEAAALSRRVASRHPEVGRVRSLEPLERGVSGRIRTLRIRGSEGSAVVRGDLYIRRLLGGLKSALFTVEPVGDRNRPDVFVLRGGGFGHGVGMCQLGAIGMAENRSQFREILHHYYPDSRLERLY